ncbi:MAG: hypothetical protein K2H70_00620, partial [Bacteroidales bacterium]|nr:hypothetical protein [Bacteroidales bacterium]
TWWDNIRTFAFWKQIALMILIVVVLVIVALYALQFFTQHGRQIRVPDMSGYTLEELRSLEDRYAFRFVIRDSVFDLSQRPGAVVSHTPKAGDIVKRRRTFYLVTAAYERPRISMPNLIDLSHRQALSLLETYDLQAGRITYVPSVAGGAVLGQFYEGEAIEPGMPIPKGARVDLEIGVSDKIKGPRYQLRKEETVDSAQVAADSTQAEMMEELGDMEESVWEEYDEE